MTTVVFKNPMVGVSISAQKVKPQRDWAMLSLAITLLVFLVGNAPFKKPLYAVLIVVYLMFTLPNMRVVFRLMAYSYSLVLLWALLCASYFWSVVPTATVDVIKSQSTFLIFAFCIAAKHQSSGFSESLQNAALALIGLVLLYCLVFPGVSLSAVGLKVFYIHKNTLGAMMALCALALFYAPGRKSLHVKFGLVAIGLLLASQSKTSISTAVACSALLMLANGWVKNFYPRSQRLMMKDLARWALFALVMLGLVALVVFRDELIGLFIVYFPETALTGRGQLWVVVMQQIRAHSLLGIGPGSFWQGGGASEIAQTTLYQKDPVWTHYMVASDGGYIDLIASFGFLGLALFLLTSVDLYHRLFRKWDQPDSRLIFVLVTFVLLHAITESTILYSTNILWLIYLLCYFRVLAPPTGQQSKLGVKC